MSDELPICRCQSDDARACWAIRNPELYLRIDKNPRCGCVCHTSGLRFISGTRERFVAGMD